MVKTTGTDVRIRKSNRGESGNFLNKDEKHMPVSKCKKLGSF